MRKAPTYPTSPCLLGGPGSQITVPRGAWQVTAACSILIVLEGELELHQRGIDRADRLHTVATEIMRGALQMQPGRFERADRGHDLRVRLLDDAAPRVVVVRPVVRSPGLCHTSLPVGRTVRPHSPDSQSVCPAGGVQGKSARAIRIGDRSATTAGAQVVAQWAAMPRSDTNIQCYRDHHAPPRDVPPSLLQPAPRRQGAPPRG